MRKSLLLPIVSIALVWSSPAEATNRISLGTVAANAGSSGIAIEVQVTNDVPIHAFSVALTFDQDYLTLMQITDEGTLTSDLGAEFFYPTIDNTEGHAVLGVIFSYNGEPFTGKALDPSPDVLQRVAVLRFDIAPEAPPGDYPLELVDDLGTPPNSNVFSNAGATIQPELQNGALTVNNENILKLDDARAQPGSRVDVNASGKHPATLQGYSIAITFDNSILTFVEATIAGTEAAFSVRPNSIEFFQSQMQEDFSQTLNRISVGVVLDYVPPFTGHEIPASPDRFQSLVRYTFNTLNDPSLIETQTCTPLAFHQGSPSSVNNMFIILQESYTPAFVDGRICFVSAPRFRRGYVNRDMKIDISDGIFMLRHLFLGDEPPDCFTAGDINDDERFDVSDAVTLFNYLFNGGEKPRAPFEDCGIDPTPTVKLSCGTAMQCP